MLFQSLKEAISKPNAHFLWYDPTQPCVSRKVEEFIVAYVQVGVRAAHLEQDTMVLAGVCHALRSRRRLGGY